MTASPGIDICDDATDGPARLIDMHAKYYARHWGFGDVFRDRVATDLAEFRAGLPHRDCGLWFARSAQDVVGSIAIDGRSAEAHGAHLRWFIVDDTARRTGAGAKLLDHALGFCRRRRFASVYLWTFAGLDAARRLYDMRGFRLVDEVDAQTWGVIVREQRFHMNFSS